MVRFLKVRKVANVTKTGKSTDPIDQPALSWITKSMHLPDFANKKAPHLCRALIFDAAVKRFFLHFTRVINPESMLNARN